MNYFREIRPFKIRKRAVANLQRPFLCKSAEIRSDYFHSTPFPVIQYLSKGICCTSFNLKFSVKILHPVHSPAITSFIIQRTICISIVTENLNFFYLIQAYFPYTSLQDIALRCNALIKALPYLFTDVKIFTVRAIFSIFIMPYIRPQFFCCNMLFLLTTNRNYFCSQENQEYTYYSTQTNTS